MASYLKDEQLTPYHSDEYMLRLVRDLLDQQIIDGQGRKVVRVTDVTFNIQHEPDGEVINIVDVDIGLRSVFRRLAQGVIPRKLIRRVQEFIPRIPFAGNIAASSKPIRSAACASTSVTKSWSECIRPIWPTSSKI